jgi:tRNA threonylcarbamoyladenosine biosynthesis protein TsaE
MVGALTRKGYASQPIMAKPASSRHLEEPPIDIVLTDAEATEALGAALARAFPGAREASAGLYLSGDLGAGKTTCVRAFLRALGVTGLIRSPTFTLVETYRLPDLNCIHVDLYRLEGSEEVEELGLRDFLGAGCLLLVEWPGKGAGAIPPPDVELALEFADPKAGRVARLRAQGSLGEAWLRDLRNDARLIPYLSNLA